MSGNVNIYIYRVRYRVHNCQSSSKINSALPRIVFQHNEFVYLVDFLFSPSGILCQMVYKNKQIENAEFFFNRQWVSCEQHFYTKAWAGALILYCRFKAQRFQFNRHIALEITGLWKVQMFFFTVHRMSRQQQILLTACARSWYFTLVICRCNFVNVKW